jgi:protein-L-isoaspartate(D-aspartate) O-methyltransferase
VRGDTGPKPEPGQFPPHGQFGRSEEGAVEVASFVLSLRARGIRDTSVLRAMELVPRDVFAPRRFSDLSRTDVALPLPCGQTMTAPRAVAEMLVALKVSPGQRVLEIGTGSGYVTAVLVKLGAQVRSIERFATLVESASEHLKIVGASASATVEIGDGLAGRSPDVFERILMNGAVAEIPPAVVSLLASGGRLVGALSIDGFPRLARIDRLEGGDLRQEIGAGLRVAPLVSGIARTL